MRLKAKVGNVTQLRYAELNAYLNFMMFQVTHQFNLQTCVRLCIEGARGHVSETRDTAWGRQRPSFNPSTTFQGINCVFVPGDLSRTHAMHMPGLQPTFNISAARLAYEHPLPCARILLA